MNLLPTHHSDFREQAYWDTFFRRRGSAAFEWYGEYAELCPLLHKYVKPKDDVLVVGCGNSSLSADLSAVGLGRLISVDVSPVVVQQMQQKHLGLDFRKADATDMRDEFEDGRFSCVLDKGTLDAIMTDEREEVKDVASKMFEEIDRVLRLGGRYVCISLLQSHILRHVSSFFESRGWPLRVVRCNQMAELKKDSKDKSFPVFAVIATKFKKMPNAKSIIEMGLSVDGQTNRLASLDDLVASVRGLQQFAAVRAGGGGGDGGIGQHFQSKDARNEDVSLDLCAPGSDKPKYSLYIAERPNKTKSRLKFAVFIVPQGRETEWLFSTREGRLQLATSADCQRLVVVHLGRDHSFANLKAVQDELSGMVLELSPPSDESSPSSSTQVPFLSVGRGADDEVGERLERCRGRSDLSGEFVVEDVECGGEHYRRLVFLNNPNLTQSEARLKLANPKKKTGKRKIDSDFLACTHHSWMIAALGFKMSDADAGPKEAGQNKRIRGLLVGLGGGALAMYLTDNFPQMHLDVVEIDPAIRRVANEQFGFAESDRLKLHIGDGLAHIEALAEAEQAKDSDRFDFVFFDVDSKDTTVGMSCPPKPFLHANFLAKLAGRCLKPDGLFVLNLVCRDTHLRRDVLGDLHKTFARVLSYRVPEEVNEILFCTNDADALPKSSKKQRSGHGGGGGHQPAAQAFQRVNDFLRAGKKSMEEDFVDLGSLAAQMQLLSTS